MANMVLWEYFILYSLAQTTTNFMANYTFGEIENVIEGNAYINRAHLRKAGIHNTLVSGIDGNPKIGCTSIVLNGGYVDDLDLGNEIVYTGHGGNDPNTNKQISDQSWEATGNKALIVNEMHGLPVRVTRGYKHKSKFSPTTGYLYGGLYYVTEHFEEIGKNGYKICRYRLIKKDVNDSTEMPVTANEAISKGNKVITRSETTVLRIVRDTKLSKEIKQLYNYECQVCGIIIEVNGVRYAEAAHIKPLGKPHNGEDTPENLICLCPNHHVMFDKGIWGIKNDMSFIGLEGKLILNKKHKLDNSNLEYHFNHIMI